MEEVTTVYETEINISEFTTSLMEVSQQGVDSMLEEIRLNTQQTAECATSLVAFTSLFFIILIGKLIWNIFHSIFS